MTEELHILHVVGAMNIGGIENMLMTSMPHMKEKGIIFDFAVHGKESGVHEKEIAELGGKVYHLPKFRGINIISYVRAWQCLLKNHPELIIIHGHMTSTASIYLMMAKYYGRVSIAHSHSTSTSGNKMMYFCKRVLEYPLRYLSDYLFACSTDAANYRFGKGTSNRSNYRLWLNAIDMEKFRPSATKRQEYREKLNIADNVTVIGHVGRMVPAKNHKFLLEIFKEYQRINPVSKLLLIGDGPLKNVIETWTKKLKIADSTIFAGAVDNPADYLSVMDIFCFPSAYEGLSVSLIEAQINEKICLGSDVIPKEVKISDNLQFLSLYSSPKMWAEKIISLQKTEETNVTINNCYDINNVSVKVFELYHRIRKDI